MTDTELLTQLLTHFNKLEEGGIFYRYMDFISLGEIDPELESHLIARMEAIDSSEAPTEKQNVR